MVIHDFLCPIHGRFEALAESDSDSALCPHPSAIGPYSIGPVNGAEGPRQHFRTCAQVSPWTPSPVAGRVELVSAVSRGKWEPPPSKLATDTRPLMEGQKYSEWRKDRKKVWRDHDHKARKERG